MLNKISVALSVVFLVISTVLCEETIQFKGLGGGGEAALVLQYNDFKRDGATGGFGLRGIVEFKFGKLGLIQYAPSFTFWMTIYDDRVAIEGNHFNQYDQREIQIALNVGDVKYMFKTSKSFFKPYAGLSVLPCFLINKHHEKYQEENSDGSPAKPLVDLPETVVSAGFNVLGGVDFPIKDRVIPFIEVRFTATKEWSFKTIGGMTLWF